MKNRHQIILVFGLVEALRTLPIDVKKDITTILQCRLDGCLRCPVEVFKHQGPLEQLTAVAHGDELLFAAKEIVLALNLTGAASAAW